MVEALNATDKTVSDAQTRARRQAYIAFAVFAVLSMLLFRDAYVGMVRTWIASTTYHHGFLVPVISAYLFWRDRRHIFATDPNPASWFAIGVLGFGLFWMVSMAADVMLFQSVAAIGALICGFVAVFGIEISKRAAFPLLFLFFMVPAGDGFIPALQDFTANFSVGLLNIIGIPVFHDGIMIETPSGLFEVAEACAGLRFLIANIMIAALFAYLSYRTTWKWVVFLALGVIIPVLANGLRAFGIIIIATLTDNKIAAGVDHIVYGWGFFAAVMLLLLFIGNLFADDMSAPAAEKNAPAQAPKRAAASAYGALAAALFAAPLYTFIAMREPPVRDFPPATPPQHATLTAADIAEPTWTPQFVGADREALKRYALNDSHIDFFVAYYDFQRQGAEVVYHANRMYNDDVWTRLETYTAAVPIDGKSVPARIDRLRTLRGELRLAASLYWSGGHFTASDNRAKLFQAGSELSGRGGAAGVIVVSTPIVISEEAAFANLRAFLEGLEPVGPYLTGLGDAPAE